MVHQSEVVFSEDIINQCVFMILHKTDHLLHLFDFGDLALEIRGDLLENSRNFHLFLHQTERPTTYSFNFVYRFQLDKVLQECCKSFYA
jgi:hypothetical protein